MAGTLMAIGAHAGDVENMAAATVLVHTRAGHRAVVVHMTLGEAGHPSLSPAVYAEQRRAEIAESARLMGAEAIVLPYSDGQLPVNDEVKLRVCHLIRQYRPTVILTHWRGSLHRDHTATHDIVREAIFWAGLPAIQSELPVHHGVQLFFCENWEDMEGWRPDIYLDTSAVWEEYLAVLRTHEFIRGGISSFRYFNYYDALGTVRGCLARCPKAVALMMPTGAWVRRVNSLPGMA